MSFWLKETDYIKLMSQNNQYLNDCITNNKLLWRHLINLNIIKEYIVTQRKNWMTSMLNYDFGKKTKSEIIKNDSISDQKIFHYMDQTVQPLPQIEIDPPIVRPYPINQLDNVYNYMDNDILLLLQSADYHSLQLGKQKALISFLLESLPKLYTNEHKTIIKGNDQVRYQLIFC